MASGIETRRRFGLAIEAVRAAAYAQLSSGADPSPAAMHTTKPFPAALRELVIENDYVTRTGKPNWAAFASELNGFHYETLRRAATGRRHPLPGLIEECARALKLRPEYFVEYRIYLTQREFDPEAVGLERALKNLLLWGKVARERV